MYSASALREFRAGNDPGYAVAKQAVWAMFGLACLLVATRVDYRVYRKRPVLIGMMAATLLGLIAVYLFKPVKGSHRWLGISGLGIQPSEFAKLVTIVFVAAALEEWLERRELFKPVVTRVAAVVCVFFVLIYKEPDLGSAAALAAIAGVMLFVAGMSMKWVTVLAVAVPPVAFLFIWSADYRWRRLMVFLDPWSDRLHDGYQAVQSAIAVGSGGVLGKGFMNGVQKLLYLPEPHNDFIYAVIAEEQGLIGATFVLVLLRHHRVARAPGGKPRTRRVRGAAWRPGITAMLGLQALVNISVVLGLLPTKGIALPFVSAGGSSMIVSLAAMGILHQRVAAWDRLRAGG